MSSNLKVYRLAMYGRSGSGKTCILAALAMPRIANPEAYSCTWIPEPEGLRRPAGDPDTWEKSDPATAFHRGRIWLEEGIDRLLQGEVPRPNLPSSEPVCFLFDFTTGEHRTLRIELLDYSGELIDPAITNDELARRLREHIRTCQGIVILAEAPPPRQIGEPLCGELLKLQQAFAVLKNGMQAEPAMDLPVALLINKWDRWTKRNTACSETEPAEVWQFLNGQPEPPHRSLVNVLRNSVTEGNFEAFGVSAFGEHQFAANDQGDVIERPRQVNPLKSFGLENPFVWVVERSDQIELANYEARTSRVSAWQVWQTWAGAWPLREAIIGRRLAARFPKRSTNAQRAHRVVWRAFRATMCHVVIFVVFLLFGCLAAEWAYDGIRIRSIRMMANDPQSKAENLDANDEWLSAYVTAPGYRHLLAHWFTLSRVDADSLLHQLRTRRDDLAWEPVEQAPDELIRVRRARDYLNGFPNGRHASEAKSIVEKAEQTKKYQANETAMNQIQIEIERAVFPGIPGATELDKLEKLFLAEQEKLYGLPFPNDLNEPLRQRQQSIQKKISDGLMMIAERKKDKRWAEFREKYYQFVHETKVSEAAQYLSQWQPPTDKRLQELERHFKERGVPALKEDVSNLLKSKLFDKAKKAIKKARDDKEVIYRLDAEQIKQLDSELTMVSEEEDKELYGQVVKYRDQEHAAAYRNAAPLKKMESTVKRYQEYLAQKSGPLDLTLTLSAITWGNTWNGYKNSVQVTLDGRPIISATGIIAEKHGTSRDIGSGPFKNRLNDNVTVHVQVVRQAWWYLVGGTADSGTATYSGTVDSLNGKVIELAADGHTNQATFVVSGMPVEPDLPKWGNP